MVFSGCPHCKHYHNHNYFLCLNLINSSSEFENMSSKKLDQFTCVVLHKHSQIIQSNWIIELQDWFPWVKQQDGRDSNHSKTSIQTTKMTLPK